MQKGAALQRGPCLDQYSLASMMVKTLRTFPLEASWGGGFTYHFYTISCEEVANMSAPYHDWMFEGVEGFIWLKQVPGTMPFIRLDLPSYGNTAYLYDYYPDEVQSYIDHGWQHPVPVGYIGQDPKLGVPLYRGANHFDADWFYTIDKGEHERAILGGWGITLT
jgi:hypothetical protein